MDRCFRVDTLYIAAEYFQVLVITALLTLLHGSVRGASFVALPKTQIHTQSLRNGEVAQGQNWYISLSALYQDNYTIVSIIPLDIVSVNAFYVIPHKNPLPMQQIACFPLLCQIAVYLLSHSI